MIQYLYNTLAAIGAFLLLTALYQYIVTRSLLAKGIKTTATVVSMQSDGHMLQYPEAPYFEFYDNSGQRHTFKNPVSTNPVVYEVGQEVEIMYNGGDPRQVKVISYWGLYRWTLLALCIGLPMLVIGLGYILFQKY